LAGGIFHSETERKYSDGSSSDYSDDGKAFVFGYNFTQHFGIDGSLYDFDITFAALRFSLPVAEFLDLYVRGGVLRSDSFYDDDHYSPTVGVGLKFHLPHNMKLDLGYDYAQDKRSNDAYRYNQDTQQSERVDAKYEYDAFKASLYYQF